MVDANEHIDVLLQKLAKGEVPERSLTGLRVDKFKVSTLSVLDDCCVMRGIIFITYFYRPRQKGSIDSLSVRLSVILSITLSVKKES